MTKSRGIIQSRRHWSADEVALLISMYPHCHTDDVGAWLGRDPKACSAAANVRGIKKTQEFLDSAAAGRIQRGKTDPRMRVTQFKPGFVPWNKGTRFVAGGRSPLTRFKKGQMSGAAQHNYLPIGSLRINTDGVLERKMTDDQAIAPARRWTPVARLVWEAAHGPIPLGHLACFKPGQRSTVLEEITVDRLECISRAELARRNHPRNKSPEYGRLVQLKGAITRQVNRITREAEQRSTTP